MPTACNPTILSRISNLTTFNAWKNITSSRITSISPTAASGVIQPTTIETNTLSSVTSELLDTTACIQEKLTALGGTTNLIQTAQEDMLRLKNEIIEAEADAAIARDRVAYIRHPEEHTSYYESWFPIDRPIQRNTVPYLMAVTVFIFVFAFLVGMSLFGVNISIIFPISTTDPISIFMSYFSWFGSTLVLAILLILTLYYFMYIKQS